MASSTFSVLAVVVLASLIRNSWPAPTPARLIDQFSCVHKNTYTKAQWKQCTKNKNNRPEYQSLGIMELSRQFSEPSTCYYVDTYNTVDSSSSCPAFCRLRNLGKAKNHLCSDSRDNDLLVDEVDGVTLIKSPKYDCNQTYPKNFMCVYNVNMPTCDNGLVVSHSDLDLSANDFVQVSEVANGGANLNTYSPATGTDWQQNRFLSSNLKVVFWSSHSEDKGKGFRLQFSCLETNPTSSTSESTTDPTSQPEGSGESITATVESLESV